MPYHEHRGNCQSVFSFTSRARFLTTLKVTNHITEIDICDGVVVQNVFLFTAFGNLLECFSQEKEAY